MVTQQPTYRPGDIVEVLESDYAWAHKIVGKRGMVFHAIEHRSPAPGQILIDGQVYDVYDTEVSRVAGA